MLIFIVLYMYIYICVVFNLIVNPCTLLCGLSILFIILNANETITQVIVCLFDKIPSTVNDWESPNEMVKFASMPTNFHLCTALASLGWTLIRCHTVKPRDRTIYICKYGVLRMIENIWIQLLAGYGGGLQPKHFISKTIILQIKTMARWLHINSKKGKL